jgi:hypothetical protein
MQKDTVGGLEPPNPTPPAKRPAGMLNMYQSRKSSCLREWERQDAPSHVASALCKMELL